MTLSGAAHAGGMFLPGRGARPLGRAGSFVAGADDGGALYYNPAGLAEIPGITLLVDGGLILNRVHYDRIDSGNNKLPGVDGDMNILPLPTVALTWKPESAKWLTVAGGIWVPYLGLDSYPENGPQRYQLVSLQGSLVLVMELAAAFKINEHFFVGAGFENMIINFRNRAVLSACTELNCAPEDPGFDSLTEVNVASYFTPSGVLGASIVYPKLRGAVSLQLPFWVGAEGTIRSRLPTDPFFANAQIVGQSGGVQFTLPLILRLGVEGRPIPDLRIEVGFDYEAWSMQDRITIQPHGIYIDNVPGLGRYYLGTQHIERQLDDSFGVHIGFEYTAPFWEKRTTARLGYGFETSATPDKTMSVLAPDGMHNMIALGGSLRVWKLRLDFGYAHVFTADRNVSGSKFLQVNPIQPSLAVPVGNGHYVIDTDILTAGLEGRF
ncbi:MAG TPA: outer membrane protein transport protein [Polyangia bacterium]|nr:outer membrane protein transport protein [Polyangia bacterium]